MLGGLVLLATAAASIVHGSALPSKPFNHLLEKRQTAGSSSLQVDLGYEVYEGVANASTGLNTWKG